MKAGKKEKERGPVEQQIRSMKLTKAIISIITIVIGLVFIIWSEQSLNIICSLFGWILCAAGVVCVVMYFVNYKDRNVLTYLALIVGVFVAVIGMWLAINPKVIESLLPSIVGLIIVISGIVNLSECATVKKQNGSFLASLILSIVTIVIGLVIFFHPHAFNDFIIILIGIGLIYDGVSNLVIMSMISAKTKEAVQEATAIDAEAKVVGEEKPAAEAMAEQEKKEETSAPTEDEVDKDQMD